MSVSKAPASLVLVGLSFFSIYFFWGSSYLANRVAIETVPPALLLGVRFSVAGALLYGWLRVRGAAAPTRAQWLSAALVGSLLMVGCQGLTVWALKTVPSGLAALIMAIYPVWAVIFDLVSKERIRPSALTLMGLGLGTAGVAFLVAPSGDAQSIQPFGVVLLIIGSLSWAGGAHVARRVDLPANPMLSAAMQMVSAGAILSVIAVVTGEAAHVNMSAISTRSFLALGYLVFFCAIAGYAAFAYLLQVTTAARVATFAYVNPVVAVFLGWLMLGEPVSVRTWISSALIVASVILITGRAKPSPAAMRPPE